MLHLAACTKQPGFYFWAGETNQREPEKATSLPYSALSDPCTTYAALIWTFPSSAGGWNLHFCILFIENLLTLAFQIYTGYPHC